MLKINPPVPANAVVATCARLVDSLPNVLEGLNSRVVSPRSPLVHAWGDRPVVVRCGVPKPGDYDPNSPSTTVVNGVSWFQAIGTKIVCRGLSPDVRSRARPCWIASSRS